MSIYWGLVYQVAQDRIAELVAEAERDRLADLASGPNRPVRVRVANLLRSIAEWIEDRPAQRIVQPQA